MNKPKIGYKNHVRAAAFPSHLDSNPYCDLLYGRLKEMGVEVLSCKSLSFRWLVKNRTRVDVLHFHWIERYYHHWRGRLFSFVTLARFILFIKTAKILGYRIVWTMHNFISHESTNKIADKSAVSFMGGNAVTAVHCEYAGDLLRKISRKSDIRIIPHGSYRQVYPDNISRVDARKKLNIAPGTRVLLFFGMIRMYKGINRLCKVFSELARENSLLLIVGKPYEKKEKTMIDTASARFESANIRFELGYVPDKDLAAYFKAADFAVFPYTNVLTSGSVILSLGFGCPVIVPRIGCLSELESFDLGIFYDSASASGLKNALHTGLTTETRREMSANSTAWADDLDWENIAREYYRVYCE